MVKIGIYSLYVNILMKIFMKKIWCFLINPEILTNV